MEDYIQLIKTGNEDDLNEVVENLQLIVDYDLGSLEEYRKILSKKLKLYDYKKILNRPDIIPTIDQLFIQLENNNFKIVYDTLPFYTDKELNDFILKLQYHNYVFTLFEIEYRTNKNLQTFINEITKKEKKIQLYIKTLMGKYITLYAEPTDTIKIIKEIIETKERIPINKQVLSFQNNILDNNKTLNDYNISHRGITLDLMIRF